MELWYPKAVGLAKTIHLEIRTVSNGADRVMFNIDKTFFLQRIVKLKYRQIAAVRTVDKDFSYTVFLQK